MSHQLQNNLTLHTISTHVFQADATNSQALQQHLAHQPVDIVMTDIPYGTAAHWQLASTQADNDPVQLVLSALLPLPGSQSIVTITVPRQQKVCYQGYNRLEHFITGKRRTLLLAPLSQRVPL